LSWIGQEDRVPTIQKLHQLAPNSTQKKHDISKTLQPITLMSSNNSYNDCTNSFRDLKLGSAEWIEYPPYKKKFVSTFPRKLLCRLRSFLYTSFIINKSSADKLLSWIGPVDRVPVIQKFLQLAPNSTQIQNDCVHLSADWLK